MKPKTPIRRRRPERGENPRAMARNEVEALRKRREREAQALEEIRKRRTQASREGLIAAGLIKPRQK